MLRRSISLVLLASVLVIGLPARASADDTLTGAGSSFVYPLVQQWTTAFEAATGGKVHYDPIGSGGGISLISSRDVDFGASDAPLTPYQFSLAKGVVQIPWALSATSIPYNLPGVTGRLRLTGAVLGAIYLGTITKWNDPHLRALNPKLPLPALAITPIYRSDASGTTFNVTEFLTRTSPDWKRRIGAGTTIEFPVGTGASRSAGVADAIVKTPGAIGYVDVAYSLQSHLPFASVKNRAGTYALPGLRSIAAAAATAATISSTDEISIVDPPAASKDAYPIATFTYVLVPLKTPKADALRAFVGWALTKGQAFGPRLLFAPIPQVVLVLAQKTLARVGT